MCTLLLLLLLLCTLATIYVSVLIAGLSNGFPHSLETYHIYQMGETDH